MRKQEITMKHSMLYDEAQRRMQELGRIKKIKEAAVLNAPPGKLHMTNYENHTKFYLRKEKTDTTGEYISKSDDSKLKPYLQKYYDEKILKIVNQEIFILEAFLKKSNDFIKQIQQTYSNLPDETKKYIHPLDMSDEDYKNYWLSIPYERKPIPDYVPFYETKLKERVRSKSEINIANALAEKGIPYKYECPLILKNGTKIHPDFTVLDVRERRVKYWEHRGMMDDKDYAKSAVERIKTLMQNGIFLGRDLIITEETSANPLGTDEIDAIIKKYF